MKINDSICGKLWIDIKIGQRVIKIQYHVELMLLIGNGEGWRKREMNLRKTKRFCLTSGFQDPSHFPPKKNMNHLIWFGIMGMPTILHRLGEFS